MVIASYNWSSTAHQLKGIECDFIEDHGDLVPIKLQDSCLEPLVASNDMRPIIWQQGLENYSDRPYLTGWFVEV
jgi:hypothetical protein